MSTRYLYFTLNGISQEDEILILRDLEALNFGIPRKDGDSYKLFFPEGDKSVFYQILSLHSPNSEVECNIYEVTS